MISFFVAGTPKSTQTGSVGNFGGRRIPMRRGGGWAAMVGAVAQNYRPATLLTGPLEVRLTFAALRPKKPKHPYPARPDLGNTSKGILDILNGILWIDDSQVIRLNEAKVYAEQPGILVEVEEA